MTKYIALVAAGMLAASSVFAGSQGSCMKQTGNQGAMACEVSMANLNLTPDQQKKMDAVMAEHKKEGCTKASEAKYMREARGILTKEQYAKFKAECNGSKEKVQS